MKTIEKTKSRAFGKDVYLLGIDEDGVKLWLNAPSWDCGWYWGFGYISTFNRGGKIDPSKCTDIDSHTHWDTSIVGKDNGKKDHDYCHNPFESMAFKETTFTEKEGWTLAEMFKRFYTLKECAEMFGRGGSHISGNCDEYLKDKELTKKINEVLIPETTKRIIEILTPKVQA